VAILTALALPQTGIARHGDGVKLVRELLSAYNDHNVESMLSTLAADVRWMSVDGGTLYIEAAGQNAIAAAMREFFERRPATRSVLRSVDSAGPFVKAIGTTDGVEHSQCATSVYELQDQKIKNVWYFAAFDCPAEPNE
jgi:hypothetical protein